MKSIFGGTMSIERRLLTPSTLPRSLWDSPNGILILPRALADAYKKIVERRGLEATALTRDTKDPPVGGLDQERTDKHFAQAFDGSCARAQLALLDPKNDMEGISDAFVLCLAGNAASITDAPCGAGAAAYSFLATILELRKQQILPRQPLHIHLIGAELSSPARSYAQEVLAELAPALESQAIFVDAEWIEWDVTSSEKNADLIQAMTLSTIGKSTRLLVLANFNAFLVKERKKQEAKKQIEEAFRHVSRNPSLAIWIEPDMNRAKDHVFPWLRLLLKDCAKFARGLFGKREGQPIAIARSNARFRPPLIPQQTAGVGLLVMAIELRRQY